MKSFFPKHVIAILVWVELTHWGWVMHICIGNLTVIGSDNGLSPGRCRTIIWANARILLIKPIPIKIDAFSFKKMHLKMPCAKWWPFCLGLSVLSSRAFCDYLQSLPEYPFPYFRWVCSSWMTKVWFYTSRDSYVHSEWVLAFLLE